ncbi:MAG: DUF1565 domain-containing protein [Leptolyngbyaceae bacterium]|nr:DUF1565 domain-containing protein [Leptolyngbyaceae bacterium]
MTLLSIHSHLEAFRHSPLRTVLGFSRGATPIRSGALAVWLSSTLLLLLPVGGHAAEFAPRATQDGTSQQVIHANATVVLFVNPATGNDASGDGSQRSPFRTLTHALRNARPGTTIRLSPGIYSAETGEQFPLRLVPGVTVYGNPSTQGDGILIRGGGDFISPTATRQNIAILGANEATLAGVTVTNPNHRGYGVWVESSHPTIRRSTLTGNQHDGISVNGTSAPLIEDNHFYGNGANGVTVFGRSHPRIQNNRFEQTGYAINVGDAAAPVITANQIVQNRSGVVVQEQAFVTLRQNVIAENQQNGVVAIAQARVDMGTADSPGQNELSENGNYDINADVADHPVMAAGNSIDSTHVIGGVDWVAQAPVVPAPMAQATRTPVPQAPTATDLASAPIRVLPPESTASPPSPLPEAGSESSVSPVATPLLSTPASSTAQSSTARSSASQSSASRSSALQPEPRSPVRIVRTSAPRSAELSLSLRPGAIAPSSTPSSSAENSAENRTDTQSTPSSEANQPEVNPPAANPPEATLNATNSPRLTSPQRLIRPQTPASSINPSAPPETEAVPIQVIFPASSPSPVTPSRANLSTARPSTANERVINLAIQPSQNVETVPVRQMRQTQQGDSVGGNPSSQPRRLINPAVLQAPNQGSDQSSAQSTAVAPTTTDASVSREEASNSHLLRVPNADVPQGHVGNATRIHVEDNPLYDQLALNTAAGQRVPLRYRVVVDPRQPSAIAVQSVVPGAFSTWVNGRSLIQVGAFADAENANELAQQLAVLGIRSEIHPIGD